MKKFGAAAKHKVGNVVNRPTGSVEPVSAALGATEGTRVKFEASVCNILEFSSNLM